MLALITSVVWVEPKAMIDIILVTRGQILLHVEMAESSRFAYGLQVNKFEDAGAVPLVAPFQS